MGGGDPAADALRALPSVEVLAAGLAGPRPLAVRAAREVIAARREAALGGPAPAGGRAGRPGPGARSTRLAAPSLRRVLNATGVVDPHQPRPRAAGPRGAGRGRPRGRGLLQPRARPRHRRAGRPGDHVAPLIAELTGAQAGFVVNNGAGAALLAVAALAGPGSRRDRLPRAARRDRRRVPRARRRAPDRARGWSRWARRTARAWPTTREAVGAATPGRSCACIRRTSASSASSRRSRSRPCAGSACRSSTTSARAPSPDLPQLDDEPPVRALGRGGRGARVLRGRQAARRPAGRTPRRDARGGGRRGAHPLARALRIDKLSLAALEATLLLHRDPAAAVEQIPVLAMLRVSEAELAARAERLAAAFPGARRRPGDGQGRRRRAAPARARGPGRRARPRARPRAARRRPSGRRRA